MSKRQRARKRQRATNHQATQTQRLLDALTRATSLAKARKKGQAGVIAAMRTEGYEPTPGNPTRWRRLPQPATEKAA